MVLGEGLTEFGGVQNPFVEENDTGAQSDPCSAGKLSVSRLSLWTCDNSLRGQFRGTYTT